MIYQCTDTAESFFSALFFHNIEQVIAIYNYVFRNYLQ